MKKILNEWRKFVIKENEEKLKEFYHATTFPMESFVNGIDTSRAKGHGQGSGFYVYPDKNRAIKHLKALVSGELLKGETADGEPIIVVINPPFTPENFDIDYEVFGKGYINFIINNKEYFFKNRLSLGIGSKFAQDPRFFKLLEKGQIKVYGKTKRTLKVDINQIISIRHGEKLGESAELLSEFDPEMHRKFEEQMLSKATALKYNGKEKIFPVRIEDIEGKVLWKKS